MKKTDLQRPYFFLEATVSICNVCHDRIGAKIILENGKVFVLKTCPVHGVQKELLEEEGGFYMARKKYDKPGTTCKTQTITQKGCPFDCGLCPDHEQHTCIGLIEITNACDLGCPLCYAKSGKGNFLSLEEIEKMMDFYIDSEHGKAEILQITGGEPTMHPQIMDILTMAAKKRFKYVMLNTNGVKIAHDISFAQKIAQIFKGGFEVYLQFDGMEPETMQKIRGRDLGEIKKKAIANLSKYHVPITLVATIEQDVNDAEIGSIISFGLEQKFVRGINFQPVAYFGRIPRAPHGNDRITLTGVLRRIEEQTEKMILMKDFIPLPCDVDRIAITYLKKKSSCKWESLMRDVELETYVPVINNSISFTMEEIARDFSKHIFRCNGAGGCIKSLARMASVIDPMILKKTKQERMDYVNENFFRITITSFVDIYNFDIKSVKKDCVHVITPDLKKIPFSTYNMFYRP